MIELTMPKLSDSMEQGTILTWLKIEGEEVQAGDDLLEIETDKATVTHRAEASGCLQILAPEGTTLPVGVPIARLGPVGEPRAPTMAKPNGRSSRQDVSAPARAEASLANRAIADVPARRSAATSAIVTEPRATPLARRVAKAHGISLDDLVGSGPLGRITRRDVLTTAGIIARDEPVEPPTTVPQGAGEASSPTGRGTIEVLEPTRLQALIARRMSQAKATVPHFQVQTEVEMDAAVRFRTQIKDLGIATPSLNDLVVKAAALALRAHPLANGSYRDGHFELNSRVNVGIAVAADHALVVPTLFDADQKSLAAIGAESKRLAERVRNGEIHPGELSGATFTVSNLGMHGMTAITPVINPPQAAILGVGALRQVLARVDAAIVDRRLMTLTLSCDHRILYGADAAEFLSMVRTLLEEPLRMALATD